MTQVERGPTLEARDACANAGQRVRIAVADHWQLQLPGKVSR